MAGLSFERTRALRSPVKAVLLVALAVFAAETLVMLALRRLPPYPLWAEALLDSTLLTLLLAPFLYVLIHRPLARRIQAHEGSEEELRRAGEELEARVRKRTSDLSRANESLQAELAVRRRAEEALRRSEERLDFAVWGANLGIWDWNVETGQVVRNERWAQMLGYALHEVEAHIRTWGELIHPDDRSRVMEAVSANLEGRVPFYQTEHRLRAKSGEWRWILDTGKVVERNENGKPVRVTGTHLDITKRKEAEAALAKSERRFREMAEAVPGVFFLVNGDVSELLFVNAACETIIGHPRERLYESPRSLFEGAHPDDRERVQEALAESLRTGRFDEEYRIVRPDGSVGWILARMTGLGEEKGTITRFAGTVQDITEVKKTEEALRQSQKLESLGVMAGGVAHQFNNLLGVLLGRASMALTRLPPEDPARVHLEKGIRAAEQAAELAAKMLAFSGRSRFVIGPTDLSALVREQRPLLEAAMGSAIRLDLDLADGLEPIEADAGQIQQALLNLVLNASEAIGKRVGTVRIATFRRPVGPDDEALWRHTGRPLPPGFYVSLEVRDEGLGMEEATLDRIFDPFFSTKFTGRGLGLAVVLGIVRGHRGGIVVESQSSRGARFELVFPQA